MSDDSAAKPLNNPAKTLSIAAEKLPNFEACTDQEKSFILSYLRANCDSTQAIRASGLDSEHQHPESARLAGWRMVRRENVRAAIEEIQLAQLGSDSELLQRFQRWSRAKMQDVLDDQGRLDLKKAAENGSDITIKAVTTRRWWDKGVQAEMTETRVELHSAPDAAKVLAKHAGLLEDTLRIKGLPSEPSELYQKLAETIARKTGRPVVRLPAGDGGQKGDAN